MGSERYVWTNKTMQAAIDLKNKYFNELSDLKAENARLVKENEKLKEANKDLSMERDLWDREHTNVQKENEALESKLHYAQKFTNLDKELIETYDKAYKEYGLTAAIILVVSRCNEAESDRDKYKKALEFYGNEDNWSHGAETTKQLEALFERHGGDLPESKIEKDSGKIAQEALK